MRKAQGEIDIPTLHCGAIAYANQLKLALIPGFDAGDAVRQQCPQSAGHCFVIRAIRGEIDLGSVNCHTDTGRMRN
jgi:hypothetical protein